MLGHDESSQQLRRIPVLRYHWSKDDRPVVANPSTLLALLPPVIILAWVTLRKLLRPQERE